MASIKLKGDTSGEVTISAPAVAGTTTLNLPATSSTLATQNALGVRNLIINGDMRIAQRGTSAVTGTSGYPVDRWLKVDNTSSYYSSQQSSTVPATLGVASSIYNVVTTPTTATGSIEKNIQYRLEGNHIAHLGYGTANAKTCTLSFWVRSNTTGTYCVSMREGTSVNRCYIVEYTINSADTWEQKTITFTGDTGGTWLSDNSRAMIITWDLGSGSSVQTATINSWHASAAVRTSNQTNWVGTSGATLYITGVQLEVGDTATPFEHRPYDMELARCFRYYWQGISIMNSYATTGCVGQPYKVRMRANPTISWSYGGTANRVYRISDGVQTTLTGPSTPTTTDQLYYIYSTVSSWAAASSTSHNGIITDLVLSAEL